MNRVAQVVLEGNMNGIIVGGAGNIIKDSVVKNNRNDGVAIYGRNNVVANCYIITNGYSVKLLEADLSELHDNYIARNERGILVDRSDDVRVYNNRVEDNVYGLFLLNLNRALIYNNSENVKIGGAKAVWSVGPAPGTNILGGGVVGGNVWISPDGRGHSQRCPPRRDVPEICETPYVIDGNNVDKAPLAYPGPASKGGAWLLLGLSLAAVLIVFIILSRRRAEVLRRRDGKNLYTVWSLGRNVCSSEEAASI
ncbi:NosD domain-containing protein [Pyrobaculum aerophilum]|uniref:Periplasmic copper-binding protein NosD beta helix domain-containing protein n=1 Tax=Pyrobaculum aerophilum TaxID=13773 RepID=A0A832W3V7_9CREN|nr:NosD domain-containing protein [Pyrobaculum aerophilum]HII46329.1 hypothetical protein [Pyrobaculum aerophilum]